VLVFRWYFRRSTELALSGERDDTVDHQIHCGPAMGSFNRWVAGTELEDWHARHVDVVADRLMTAAAQVLRDRIAALAQL
jgi:trans-AT polyketide synthase, acyltransferase and oxidoreductase domains